MTKKPSKKGDPGSPFFLSGGGITGELARNVDWAKTSLGPAEGWPTSLKTIVGTLLHSRHPMFLWWGPDLIQFYNDAYLPSFGKGKHPAAMGQAGRLCWGEIWPIIWPQIDDVMSRDKASWNEDQLVPIFRNGRIEEVYWTYGYSPVFDEDGSVGGTLVVCTETTARVLGERRLTTMRALAETTTLATDRAAVAHHAAEVLRSAANDIPFALICDLDVRSGVVRPVAWTGLTAEQALQMAEPAFQRELGAWAGPLLKGKRPDQVSRLPVGPWPEPTPEVLLAPILTSAVDEATSFIVFGLSPMLPFDDAYRDHLEQITEHLARAETRIEARQVRAAVEAERTNLLLQAPVATAVLAGPAHVYVLANELYCKVVNRHDLVGKAYVQAFPELIGTALPGILDRVYQTGEPYATNETVIALDRRGDGTLEDCFFKFNLEPMRDVKGTVYGMMAVAVDITEQVRARHVLEKAQVEREQLLTDLESAGRAKDEFLAMLGHELRNPLSPIVTALQLMKLRGDSRSSREQSIIERQVKHLVRLVDDLLDVSKITRGKVELEKEMVELSEVLARAVEIASFLFEQRSHRLTIDVDRSGLCLEADPVRLSQVVANLLTNAARYTPVGGNIRLAARREGTEIVISVKDDGMGISAEMLPRIFDVFVQATRSADRAEGGLGIGLTLVKSLVAMHGGTVVARSDGPGKGSELVIRLPAAGAPLALPPRVTAAAPPPVQPRRVLLVDDNADAAELLGEMLRASGHDVTIAYDPLAALALVEDLQPEVAVLDIGLPVMDGYELGAKVRAKVAGCHLVALTGYGQGRDRARSEEAGFTTHLVKPVDRAELLRIIEGARAPDLRGSGTAP